MGNISYMMCNITEIVLDGANMTSGILGLPLGVNSIRRNIKILANPNETLSQRIAAGFRIGFCSISLGTSYSVAVGELRGKLQHIVGQLILRNICWLSTIGFLACGGDLITGLAILGVAIV